ncbi:Ig-like domain-containing protein [Bacterioplanoides sp.]|uniref:Ig-like domain-containing protein n=1 Tax=Bacterioplanoides sp. TaxID=2066072 RepID=UPI003B58EF8E
MSLLNLIAGKLPSLLITTLLLTACSGGGGGSNNGDVNQSPSAPVSAIDIQDISDQNINEDESWQGFVTITLNNIDAVDLNLNTTSNNQTLLPDNNLEITATDAFYSLTATPLPNQNGTATITIEAESNGISERISFELNVTSVNDVPEASNQSVSTNEDTPLAIILAGADIDGNDLTFEIVNSPSNGKLGGTVPNLTYAPNADYHGDDHFTFKVNDESADSEIATVNITINAQNDAPTATAQTVTTDEDVPLAISLAASDIDGTDLTFEIVNNPTNGEISGTAPNLTYKPNANYHGDDSFTFKANDGAMDSETATVNISINAQNDTPIALAASGTTTEDTLFKLSLNGMDVDGDDLTFTVHSQPSKGSVVINGNEATYTPNTNENGNDAFEFSVSDGISSSNKVTASIIITPVNDAPRAIAQEVTTNEDTRLSITLAGSDIDGDNLTFEIVNAPTNGVLTGTAPDMTYTPNADINGSDSFTFKVTDGAADSQTATVNITINAVNDNPIANNVTATTNEDTSVTIDLNATDPENDDLTYAVSRLPTKGRVEVNGSTAIYTPNLNEYGSDYFFYSAMDGNGGHAVATATITVTPVNDAPVATTQTVETIVNEPIEITLMGTDIENDTLSYSVKTGPSNGSLTGETPNLTYTPNTDYSGEDSFTFTVNDGELNSSTATISIEVTRTEITRMTPTRVSTLGGSKVEIFGSGLSMVGVKLDLTMPLSPDDQRDDYISLTMPAKEAGSYQLEIGNQIKTIEYVAPLEALQVSAGGNHGCAVLTDNRVACWGGNEYGQLGNGTRTSTNLPVIVNGINNAQSVSAGFIHSCAVLSDNSLMCWGSNYHGQLGNGKDTNSNIPVKVNDINSAHSVVASVNHSCAVLADNSMVCWGGNYGFQLGYGYNLNKTNSPLPVSALDNIKSVSLGENHNCAILTDDSLTCWVRTSMVSWAEARRAVKVKPRRP